ncbi:MAG: 3-hydroxyacyl-CoA dehydrogenase NAD-binding domain-containing protein [Alphaproteobacteria bacterium]
MTNIKKIGVLGSGVMGSGIAAHMANSGYDVVLLDIVPKDAKNRNQLAEGAVEKQLKAKPSGFVHKKAAKRVTCGNLEDDLKLLSECDWVVEAVIEKLEIKHAVYKKIDSVRKADAVVSSNTSTIPLHELTKGFSDGFKNHFMITHFFNPPRFMRLLEVVQGSCNQKSYENICDFADRKLGKGVVECKDTPGFIANRIGIYWLMRGLTEAISLKIPVEQADAVMGKPVGIPKTGVFGLFDLVGIDLMPLIAKEMSDTLPKNDPFNAAYDEPEVVKKMIAEGYTGRKGKGGFYKLNTDEGKKVKEVIDLATGDYYPQPKKVSLASIDAGKGGLRAVLEHEDIGGQYASAVLLDTLHYAASLAGEISDHIADIDEAMKLGYNWKYGPFEMIDKLGVDWFASALENKGKKIPAIIEKAAGKSLYQVEGGERKAFTIGGGYEVIHQPDGSLMLADIKLTGKPVAKNASTSIWDLGDGFACLEFTSKANSIDPEILAMVDQSIAIVKKDFKGLVIGNDGSNFSVGANLGFVMMAANIAAWKQIGEVIKSGQQAFMNLKYAPFPVVSSLSGMAVGGGCEINLHVDKIQAHMESYIGLVEVCVGLIPGWGGCKEMLVRHLGEGKKSGGGMMGNLIASGGAMPAISKAFEQIALAKVAMSAEEARDMKILLDDDHITMNRLRVLADAKSRCIELAEGYTPPEPAILHLPGKTAKVALNMAVDGFKASGKATPHDVTICKHLAVVLSGGDTDMSEPLTEQHILDLEYEAFMDLVKMRPTLDRIEHMLETNKPLRN